MEGWRSKSGRVNLDRRAEWRGYIGLKGKSTEGYKGNFTLDGGGVGGPSTI